MPLKFKLRAALSAAILTATLAGAPAALAWTPPPAIAQAVVKTTNVPIKMSDGVVLYADVVRPANSQGQALPGLSPSCSRRPRTTRTPRT